MAIKVHVEDAHSILKAIGGLTCRQCDGSAGIDAYCPNCDHFLCPYCGGRAYPPPVRSMCGMGGPTWVGCNHIVAYSMFSDLVWQCELPETGDFTDALRGQLWLDPVSQTYKWRGRRIRWTKEDREIVGDLAPALNGIKSRNILGELLMIAVPDLKDVYYDEPGCKERAAVYFYEKGPDDLETELECLLRRFETSVCEAVRRNHPKVYKDIVTQIGEPEDELECDE